jgi:uncharacterized protein
MLRGIMGFFAASRVHTAQLLRMSDHLPLVIEIVDSEDYIERLLPFLDEVIVDGMVTMGKVRILHYRSRSEKR